MSAPERALGSAVIAALVLIMAWRCACSRLPGQGRERRVLAASGCASDAEGDCVHLAQPTDEAPGSMKLDRLLRIGHRLRRRCRSSSFMDHGACPRRRKPVLEDKWLVEVLVVVNASNIS